MFVMKMDSKGERISTPLGDVSGKWRFGIIVEMHPDYMVVVVLETNDGSGLRYKSPAQRSECFGVVLEGQEYLCMSRDKKEEPVVVRPGLGLLELPRTSKYLVPAGVNANLCNTAMVCFDSRVAIISQLPSELTNRVVKWRTDMIIEKAIDRLPVDLNEEILRKARERIDRKKEKLVNEADRSVTIVDQKTKNTMATYPRQTEAEM
jgi:hypothetical protein